MGFMDIIFTLSFYLGSAFYKWVRPSKVIKEFPHEKDIQDFLAGMRTLKLFSRIGVLLGFGPRYKLLRSLFAWVTGDVPTVMTDENLEVKMTSLDGVEVKLYIPKTTGSSVLHPGMVFLHGGGWVMGSADEMDGLTRQLAKNVPMVIASVNYRLSPEHPFPTPLDDCVKAATYFLTHAKEFSVDASRVAVAGDSAGGNLAAATALQLRDKKVSPSLKMQVLIYPCLQVLDLSTPSYQQFANDPYLDRTLMTQMYAYYALGDDHRLSEFVANRHISSTTRQRYVRYYMNPNWLPESNRGPQYKPLGVTKDKDPQLQSRVEKIILNPYFSPLLADDLHDLPMTYIMTCEQDVVRDDGFLYGKRLKDAGVVVKHDHYQALHALLDLLDLPLAQQAMTSITEYLKQNL